MRKKERLIEEISKSEEENNKLDKKI